jgi:hypothetical protein
MGSVAGDGRLTSIFVTPAKAGANLLFFYQDLTNDLVSDLRRNELLDGSHCRLLFSHILIAGSI